MAAKSCGNWMFEKKLGSGGFGQVELWKEKNTNKRIAIKKCILPTNKLPQKQKERWQEEIKHLKILNHINIVKWAPLPSEMHFDGPIVCMEYCNGGDLRKILRKPENSCGLLQNEVLSIMKDISSAICFLHSQQITHRDIKPENIVLHKQQNGMIIYKLIDLGYAKNIGNVTVTASLVGTFSYVAPELFKTNRYTSSVDYWSLGILFFEVLTGHKPFMPYTENLVKWVKSILTKQYEEICAKEIDEKIRFYNYIIHPTDLSEKTLSDLVEWFQIALQSDPKKRGKSKSTGELVIFTLLKPIFPLRTIRIFFVSLYQFDDYHINHNTTLLDVQKWIETKFSISFNDQEIVTPSGKVLNEIKNVTEFLVKEIPDSFLYVFKKKCLKVPQLDDNGKLPEILDILLVHPKEIKDHSQLRQCFTALIYVMRQDVFLFEQYIFALGVKLDIVKNKLYTLHNNIQKSLPRIESLSREIQKTLKSYELSALKIDWKDVNDLCNKVKNIDSTVTNIESERQHLENEVSNAFDSEKLVQSLQIFTSPYEKFLDMYKLFDKENPYQSDEIIDKVNELTLILSEYDNLKTEQFESLEMKSLVEQLMKFEIKLNQFAEGIKSIIELIPYYEKKLIEFNNIKNQNAAGNVNPTMPNVNQSLFKNDDAEIRDNIVLRNILDEQLKKSLQQLHMYSNY